MVKIQIHRKVGTKMLDLVVRNAKTIDGQKFDLGISDEK